MAVDEAGTAIAPRLPGAMIGRRRRPSGEPPPLPYYFDPNTRRLIGVVLVTAVFWAALSVPLLSRLVTAADLVVARALARVRFSPLTRAANDFDTIATGPLVMALGWATLVVVVAFRRFRRLVVYLAVLLGVSILASTVALSLGRMRPAGVVIAGHWSGYANPSRPVVTFALVTTGALYTLIPRGRIRNNAGWAAVAALGLLALCRLYLGTDHLTDVLAAAAIGRPFPVVAFRLLTPDAILPVSYRRKQRAHLEIGGAREHAIVEALDNQLGLGVLSIEPFGNAASAGSTPLKIRVRQGEQGGEATLFAKLYALSHLRSDRWYKLGRTVLYGRLEDEKPFSTVRRLVEYEDHLLRLFRDVGLPTPAPYGFVELTPEREYLIVMEMFDGAAELAPHGAGVATTSAEAGTAEVSDLTIDEGLAIVRRMWDAGVAHRDLKPSNLLTRDGHVLLIDVAFGTVRPSPWRQAVDLANMMLTLALVSSPERVYERACRVFAPEDIAEAFAACRSVTVPTQLRSRIRAGAPDLVARFRSLAPDRPPVSIQSWTLQRAGVTLVLAAAVAGAAALLFVYVNVVGLR